MSLISLCYKDADNSFRFLGSFWTFERCSEFLLHLKFYNGAWEDFAPALVLRTGLWLRIYNGRWENTITPIFECKIPDPVTEEFITYLQLKCGLA